MKTAEQILVSKGYDANQAYSVVYENLDGKTRGEFGIDEPVHLFEKYYLGDADANVMERIALDQGYDSCIDLLGAMDSRLIELAEDYPANSVEL